MPVTFASCLFSAFVIIFALFVCRPHSFLPRALFLCLYLYISVSLALSLRTASSLLASPLPRTTTSSSPPLYLPLSLPHIPRPPIQSHDPPNLPPLVTPPCRIRHRAGVTKVRRWSWPYGPAPPRPRSATSVITMCTSCLTVHRLPSVTSWLMWISCGVIRHVQVCRVSHGGTCNRGGRAAAAATGAVHSRRATA